MPRRSEFVDHILDLLAPMGEVSARAMFGGFGVYADGTIFAIVCDDILHLKVTNDNRAEFEAAGCEPYVYVKPGGGSGKMSYWTVPGEVMDDRDELLAWAGRALAASRAVRRPKR